MRTALLRARLGFLFPLLAKEGARGRSSLTQHFSRGTERERRRALRTNATAAERQLWRHLRGKQLGVKFRRQYSVDVYVLDFHAARVRLAVEVDGDSHFRTAAAAYDEERTTHLKRFGIEVLRFTNLEVFKNPEGVLHTIVDALKHRTATSPWPPPSKGGGIEYVTVFMKRSTKPRSSI